MQMRALNIYGEAFNIYFNNLKGMLLPIIGYFGVGILMVIPIIIAVMAITVLGAGSGLLAALALLSLFPLLFIVSLLLRYAYTGICWNVLQGRETGAGAVIPWLKEKWRPFIVLAVLEIFTIAIVLICVLVWASVIQQLAFILIILFILFFLAVLVVFDLAAAKLVVGSAGVAASLGAALKFVRAKPLDFAVIAIIYCLVFIVCMLIPFGRFIAEMQINCTAMVLLAREKT